MSLRKLACEPMTTGSLVEPKVARGCVTQERDCQT